MLFQDTAKHNSRHWGRAAHCWGAAVAKNLGNDFGCTSSKTQKLSYREFYTKDCFLKNSGKWATGIKIARATTQLQEAPFIQRIM